MELKDRLIKMYNQEKTEANRSKQAKSGSNGREKRRNMRIKDQIWYGGDYNPDQWPQEIWEEDMDYMQKAHMNIMTLPVFSWARIQKDETSFDLDWLIRVIDMAKERNIQVCLATSTAVQPSWLSKKYPEMLPVDREGRRRKFGGRVKFCPNNKDYKIAARNLTKKLAETFKDYPNILLWHIGNEYDNYCYCETCRKAFVTWAKNKYKTIETLNERWYLQFWGHQLYDFDEIVLPDQLSETWDGYGLERTTFQSILLDYKRFMNDSILSCYLNELEVIRAITPNIPVTTNLMGTFKPLDYFKWAKHMDIVSWDHYPDLKDRPFKSALRHDLMRSLKGGQSFLLMEQSPSQQNWAPYVNLKRPGQLRLQSYQTLAHGADSIMFFQMRRSVGNCEKFHGALIDHVGHGDTRVYKECQALGKELEALGSAFTESRVEANVGIIFDWENWWAIEMASGPSVDLRYMDIVEAYYEAFYDHHVGIDFVEMQSDYSGFDIIVAPTLYMVKEGVADRLTDFVKKGGTLITTTFSGYADENDLITPGGYPGPLKELLGIWVEEIDGLYPDMTNSIVINDVHEAGAYLKKSYSCRLLCDVIHLGTAEAIGRYGTDFYKDTPVVTVNTVGSGKAYYIGTQPESGFLKDLTKMLLDEKGLLPELQLPQEVEMTHRVKGDQVFLFLLNHGEKTHRIDIKIKGYDLVSQQMIASVIELGSKAVAVIAIDKK